MNCSPTLTAEEFKILHNSLYYLDCIGNEKVSELVETIRGALKGAYAQDNQAFQRKNDHYDRIRSELGLQTTWSIYEVDNLSDRHPFEGADRVVYRDHWGDRPVSKSINGLTWAALYLAADACIRDSGDGHHSFIEGFCPDANDPRTLILSTGS